jgi:hypothetical protein
MPIDFMQNEYKSRKAKALIWTCPIIGMNRAMREACCQEARAAAKAWLAGSPQVHQKN